MEPKKKFNWNWLLAAALAGPLLFVAQLVLAKLPVPWAEMPYRAIAVGLLIGIGTFPIAILYLGLIQHYWRESKHGIRIPIAVLCSVFFLNILVAGIFTSLPY